MVGRPLSDMYPTLDAKVGETVVKVEELTRSGIFAQLHSRLKPGRFWDSEAWSGVVDIDKFKF